MARVLQHPRTRKYSRISGLVQGVGFRPFVHSLAKSLALTGFVANDENGVFLEVQGSASSIDKFFLRLYRELPPLARIDSLQLERRSPIDADGPFHIELSQRGGTARAEITPDAATCPDCRFELLDAENWRHGYALINCTNCGPRFSIVRAVPYDRPNTSMAGFEMCDRCRAEYENPDDRRFHAQPIACDACGPQVELIAPDGHRIEGDPLEQAVILLARGQIVAVKGLGGFHLACRADSHTTVSRLRARKNREAKPFALMARDLEVAKRLAKFSLSGRELLTSPSAPIVLARRRENASVDPAVAPDNDRLGVMLAYTPLHHLLFAHPKANFDVLVMTSGNRSEEPLATTNAEAKARLGGLCDGLLCHDRPIVRPVDDSIWLDRVDAAPLPLRRSRGFTPVPFPLRNVEVSDGLAVGGELKAVVAVVRGGNVVCGQHLGNRVQSLADDHARRSVADLLQLLDVKPKWIAHDLHPGYASTAYAKELAETLSVPRIAVQHHHAHAASVLAEHGESGPALALVLDGTGYGTDGTIWGGELLKFDLLDFERLGFLHALPLLGGDAATRDPRRTALAMLSIAYGSEFHEHWLVERLFPQAKERATMVALLQRGMNCFPSHGAGRWFDAVAALLGICTTNRFEAEAPIALEACAQRSNVEHNQRWIHVSPALELNPTKLVRELSQRLLAGEPVPDLARRFHLDLAQALATAATLAAGRTGLHTVVLSGGALCNELLSSELVAALRSKGFRVLTHGSFPPNDGGLSLGQAAVACARFAQPSFCTKSGGV